MTTPSTSQSNAFSSNWKKLQETLKVKRENGERRVEMENGKKRKVGQNGRIEGDEEKRWKRKKKNEEIVENEENGLKELTKVVAMDCEYVGVGEDGTDNMVARVSLVNGRGECVYDKFVKPVEPVIDYRTAVSGVREEDVLKGEDFAVVQREVCKMIERRRLVGHSIQNDLKVLHLSHPKRAIRDTAKYAPFRAIARTKRPALKKLCRLVLGTRIQEGEHDSICDARSALQLYQLHKRDWERWLRKRRMGLVEVKKKKKDYTIDKEKRNEKRKQRREKRRDRNDKRGRTMGKNRNIRRK